MVICSNCHIEIDDSKIVLHERFCIQNIKYCATCQEGFPIEEFDEHLAGHLSRQPSKNISKEELQKKNSLSLQRLESKKIGCKYCNMPLSYSLIEEHEEMCGSRTNPCPFCDKLILMKDMESHRADKHFGQAIPLGKKPSFMMSEDELLARAVEESLKESGQKEDNKEPMYKKKMSKEEYMKKKSSGINMDEIDYEYERQLEEEMYAEDNQ